MILIEDFKGLYNLSRNKFTKEDLECDIELYEPLYLCYLLGKELADLYLADLDPITKEPLTQRFLDIYAPMCIEHDACFCSKETPRFSIGIKKYLLGVIYYYHVVTHQNRHTMSGMVQSTSELSLNSANYDLFTQAELRYNGSVGTAKAIQAYIQKNKDLYPEYKGTCLAYKFSNLF